MALRYRNRSIASTHCSHCKIPRQCRFDFRTRSAICVAVHLPIWAFLRPADIEIGPQSRGQDMTHAHLNVHCRTVASRLASERLPMTQRGPAWAETVIRSCSPPEYSRLDRSNSLRSRVRDPRGCWYSAPPQTETSTPESVRFSSSRWNGSPWMLMVRSAHYALMLLSGAMAKPMRVVQLFLARICLRKRLTLATTGAGGGTHQYRLEVPFFEGVFALEKEDPPKFQSHTHQPGILHQ